MPRYTAGSRVPFMRCDQDIAKALAAAAVGLVIVDLRPGGADKSKITNARSATTGPRKLGASGAGH